jgi:hypothetical protein
MSADTKFVVVLSTFFSLISILAVVIMVPALMGKISEIQDRVNDGVQVSPDGKFFQFLIILGFPCQH